MNVEEKDKYTLVTIDKSFTEFIENLRNFDSNHIILKVSDNLNIDKIIISLFLKTAARFKQDGMSFVVIKLGIDIDNFPENLSIVPTLQEAEDVLEMEAIERDLGF